MLPKLVVSFIAVVRCGAFAFAPSMISQHHAAQRTYVIAPLSLFSHNSAGSSEHFLDRERPSASASASAAIQQTSEIWELGLVINSKANIPLEYTCRCINQVVGISEADSLELVSQAYRHGIALIDELPLDVAVSYKTELERCGLSCEMVPADDDEGAAPHAILEDLIDDDMWELGLIRDGDDLYSREYTSRCLCQVAGLSEANAYEATGQACRHGVALIDNFHSEHAEHVTAELTRMGIAVCVVPASDEETCTVECMY